MPMGSENMIVYEYVCFKCWARLYAFGIVVEGTFIAVLCLKPTYYSHLIQHILNSYNEMHYSVHHTS